MASTTVLRATRTTTAGTDDLVYDMNSITGTTFFKRLNFLPADGATKVGAFISDDVAGGVPGNPILSFEFASERVAADVTISSSMTFNHPGRDFTTMNPLHATFRVEVSKITTSGNVESPIGSLTEPAVASGEVEATLYAATIPVPTPVTVATGERFILRIWLVPAPGQTMVGSSTAVFIRFGATGVNIPRAELTFAETITWTANTARVFFRDTSNNGIGVFQDFSLTAGGAASTNLTGVPLNAVETQWTKTGGLPAALAQSALINSTTDGTSFVSGSITPIANRLYILAVAHSDSVAPETTIPTIATTTGLNFVQIASVPFNTAANNLFRLTVFRAMKPSGLSAGTITISFGDTTTGVIAHLAVVTNIVTSGTDGSGAVTNIVTGSADATANPSISLAAASNNLNSVLAIFATDNATPTLGSGTTTVTSSTQATPTMAMLSEFAVAFRSPITATVAACDWGGVALELVSIPQTPLLEWVTPRFTAAWNFAQPDATVVPVTVNMSGQNITGSARHISVIAKMFRLRGGVEDLIYRNLSTAELNTGAYGGVVFTGLPDLVVNPMSLLPDDRLVFRFYYVPTPTLSNLASTVGLQYNASSGNGYIDLYDVPVNPFKLETDPATPATVPSAMAKTGLQN